MIIIIGHNLTISEGLADLISENQEIQFIEFPPKRSFRDFELKALASRSSLIIINLDNIYQSAVDFIQSIRKINHEVKILALDTHQSPSIANHLLDQGISAYLPITTNTQELSKAINACLSGETYIAL